MEWINLSINREDQQFIDHIREMRDLYIDSWWTTMMLRIPKK